MPESREIETLKKKRGEILRAIAGYEETIAQAQADLAHLAQMRAAKSMPWDDDRTALYRTIFPQMTGCLPEEEGAQLRFDFETELARLEAA